MDDGTRTDLVILHVTVGSVLQKHKGCLHVVNCSCPVQSGFA